MVQYSGSNLLRICAGRPTAHMPAGDARRTGYSDCSYSASREEEETDRCGLGIALIAYRAV